MDNLNIRENNNAIILRPHHGLCIRHFVGYGYDEKFTLNMRKIVDALNRDSAQEIILQSSADILCSACPHNNEGLCTSITKVESYDTQCLSLCNLQEGQCLCWQDFQQIITDKLILNSSWKLICKGCNWLSLCEEISKALK